MQGQEFKFITPFAVECSECRSVIPKSFKTLSFKRHCKQNHSRELLVSVHSRVYF